MAKLITIDNDQNGILKNYNFRRGDLLLYIRTMTMYIISNDSILEGL